jgi:hypothetical protein
VGRDDDARCEGFAACAGGNVEKWQQRLSQKNLMLPNRVVAFINRPLRAQVCAGCVSMH